MARQLKVYMSFVVALVALIYRVQAQGGTVRVPERPPGNCAYEGTHPIGSVWTGRDCTKNSCVKRGGQTFVDIHGCGKTRPPPGCILVPGSGSYPACCPKPKCPSRQFFQFDYEPNYVDTPYDQYFRNPGFTQSFPDYLFRGNWRDNAV